MILKFYIYIYSWSRRFGAWSNPNFCYVVGVTSTSHVPYGVKPCKQGVNLLESNANSKVLTGNMNKTSHSIASVDFLAMLLMAFGGL